MASLFSYNRKAPYIKLTPHSSKVTFIFSTWIVNVNCWKIGYFFLMVVLKCRYRKNKPWKMHQWWMLKFLIFWGVGTWQSFLARQRKLWRRKKMHVWFRHIVLLPSQTSNQGMHEWRGEVVIKNHKSQSLLCKFENCDACKERYLPK